MRIILAVAALAVATAAPSQEVGPGTAVERVTLHPGDTASFTLAPGKDHQLLNAAPSSAKGAITIRYEVSGGRSTIGAVSHTGYPLMFTVLVDPDGDGGYTPAGDVQLAGDGTAAERSWPGSLGTVNVGDFVGGPHGSEAHPASGD